MIDDPIQSIKSSLPDAFDEATIDGSQITGEHFFVILSDYPYLVLARADNGFAIWGTCPSIEYRFFSDWCGKFYTSITCEEFIDHVKTYYPDHFEWLLFHPEWLL